MVLSASIDESANVSVQVFTASVHQVHKFKLFVNLYSNTEQDECMVRNFDMTHQLLLVKFFRHLVGVLMC